MHNPAVQQRQQQNAANMHLPTLFTETTMDTNIYHYKSKTMGTDLEVDIVSDKNPDIAYGMIELLCMEYEERFSRFKETSELSRVNREKRALVSDTFIEVMNEVERLYRLTSGIFNPLCSPKHLGYTQTFDDLSKHQSTQYESAYSLAFDDVSVDITTNTIALQKDQMLDFGGFLKGYVSDIAVKTLEQFQGGVVNIGGDISARGFDDHNNEFVFNIADPFDITHQVGYIRGSNMSVATSSTLKRRWDNNKKEYNHIIDPRTKDSVRNTIASITVVADSGSTADALATVGDILGLREGLAFFENINTAVLFIDMDNKLHATSAMEKILHI